MKTKRLISLLLVLVMAAVLFAGCSKEKESGKASDGKISISMYLWDRSMLKELSPPGWKRNSPTLNSPLSRASIPWNTTRT